MNEIASALNVQCLFPNGGVDCNSFCSVYLGEAVLDFCSVCGEPAASHPADAFPDDDDDDDAT